MDLAFLIVILLIIVITFGFSFLVYVVIKKAALNKWLRWFALLPVLILFYFVYIAFYPPDSFYEEDFLELTGVEFPESGEILYGEASYPDIHGDYQSAFIAKVDSDFFRDLPAYLLEHGLKKQANDFDSFELEDILGTKENTIIDAEYWVENENATFYYVGFLSDERTLLIRRVSW